ncbi:hypothetical protein SBC2_78410 (plasmid) [Caballeronia sp. SBC2]|nr:hypothetical protein SBC2_78410 [Caballeronia sp. SBC2]
MDDAAWKDGFKAGRVGKSLDDCPYCDAELWEWFCGFLNGRSKPLRLVANHQITGDSTSSN